ncbi:MAG: hypothetical protein CMJ70_09280 [Planctomycetaceae bacterium]|nr:hypothetical protein [Planctomycetaceae bacterium]
MSDGADVARSQWMPQGSWGTVGARWRLFPGQPQCVVDKIDPERIAPVASGDPVFEFACEA